jgi:hypothetical protein
MSFSRKPGLRSTSRQCSFSVTALCAYPHDDDYDDRRSRHSPQSPPRRPATSRIEGGCHAGPTRFPSATRFVLCFTVEKKHVSVKRRSYRAEKRRHHRRLYRERAARS